MSATSRVGDVPCECRELADFPHAARLLAALDDAIARAAGRRLRYHVYGGFLRAAVAGGSFSDVDLAAATPSDLRALRALRRTGMTIVDDGIGIGLRLDVLRRAVATPEELLADVDVVAARLAYSTTDGRLRVDPGCLDALADGLLTLRPGPLANAERTIARTLKGVARGGRLPLADLQRSVAGVRETPTLTRWLRRGLQALRHAGAYAAGGPT